MMPATENNVNEVQPQHPGDDVDRIPDGDDETEQERGQGILQRILQSPEQDIEKDEHKESFQDTVGESGIVIRQERVGDEQPTGDQGGVPSSQFTRQPP